MKLKTFRQLIEAKFVHGPEDMMAHEILTHHGFQTSEELKDFKVPHGSYYAHPEPFVARGQHAAVHTDLESIGWKKTEELENWHGTDRTYEHSQSPHALIVMHGDKEDEDAAGPDDDDELPTKPYSSAQFIKKHTDAGK